MSMISEQIDDLQMLSEILHGSMIISPKMEEKTNIIENRVKIIDSAIDTIKTQSEKLHAYAMERSSQHYHDGWIPVDERLPNDAHLCLITVLSKDDKTEICLDTGYYNGKWSTYSFDYDLYDVVAWRPLPEPYKGSDVQ